MSSAHPHSELSANQRSMLDLAVGCDLRVSEPGKHPAIRARHHAIKTNQDATDYIREVENKIHTRRRFKPLKPNTPPAQLVKPLAMPLPVSGVQASFAIIFLMALMIVTGWFAPAGVNLVLVTLCMLLVMLVMGIAITKNPLGVLISDRNLMSLARFQMALWTVLILGAYFTYAMVRIKAMAEGSLNGHPVTDALNIQIDWHLWALLGISTTSLVGAPLILSTKKDKEPAPLVTQKTAQMVNEPEQDVIANKQGTLYANKNISDARLTDMFQGDELTNTTQIDLAKVQMFYFTVIAAICFFVMVVKQLVSTGSDLSQLPLLPDGFVAILGISHAGYLTSKSISHTKSQP